MGSKFEDNVYVGAGQAAAKCNEVQVHLSNSRQLVTAARPVRLERIDRGACRNRGRARPALIKKLEFGQQVANHRRRKGLESHQVAIRQKIVNLF